MLLLGGGVSIKDSETLAIDIFCIKKIFGHGKINILIINQAAEDINEHTKSITRLTQIYNLFLKNPLYFGYLNSNKIPELISIGMSTEEYIKEFDIIYIQGGNVIKLISFLKEYNITHLLKDMCFSNHKLCIGKSAGAIVFFQTFIYFDGVEKNYNYSNGMNMINCTVCAHFTQKKRKRILTNYTKEQDGFAIGIDEKSFLLITANKKVIELSYNNSRIFYFQNGIEIIAPQDILHSIGIGMNTHKLNDSFIGGESGRSGTKILENELIKTLSNMNNEECNKFNHFEIITSLLNEIQQNGDTSIEKLCSFDHIEFFIWEFISYNGELNDKPYIINFLNQMDDAQFLYIIGERIKTHYIDTMKIFKKTTKHYLKEDFIRNLISSKFPSIVYIEQLYGDGDIININYPDNMGHIDGPLKLLIEKGFLSKNMVDVLTENNNRVLNIKFIRKQVLKYGNNNILNDLDLGYSNRDIQKKLFFGKVGIDYSLFSGKSFSSNEIIDLYDISRNFYEGFGQEICLKIFSEISLFLNTTELSPKTLRQKVIPFIKVLYANCIISKDIFQIGAETFTINGFPLKGDIEELFTNLKKNIESDFVKQGAYSLNINDDYFYKLLDNKLKGDLYSLSFLSGRFSEDSLLSPYKELFYNIIYEFIRGTDKNLKFIETHKIPYINIGQRQDMINQINRLTGNQITKRSENINKLSIINNEKEYEDDIKNCCNQYYDIFIKTIEDIEGSIGSTTTYTTAKHKSLETLNGVDIVNQYGSSKEGLISFLSQSKETLLKEISNYDYLKKFGMLMYGKLFEKRLISGTNSTFQSQQLIKRMKLSQTLFKETKGTIKLTESIIFLSSLDDVKSLLEIGSKETVYSRSCLDYEYLSESTGALLSLCIDANVKPFICRTINEESFKNKEEHKTVTNAIKNSTITKDYDPITKQINFHCSKTAQTVTIGFKSGIFRCFLRIGESLSDNSPALIIDNIQRQDQPIIKHVKQFIINQFETIAQDFGAKIVDTDFKCLGTLSPLGQYSDLAGGFIKYGNDLVVS